MPSDIVPRRTALEDRIRDLLRDLGRALADAIAESSDVNDALRRLQKEGYGLIILLDRRGSADTLNGRDVRVEAVAGKQRRFLTEPSPMLPAPDRSTQGVPVFQINGGDLAFLKSIGIDPTRRVRGRRMVKREPDAPDLDAES